MRINKIGSVTFLNAKKNEKYSARQEELKFYKNKSNKTDNKKLEKEPERDGFIRIVEAPKNLKNNKNKKTV